MTSSGTPMLADFGLSRSLIYSDRDLITSSYGNPKGTPNWMAYELVMVIWESDPEFICTKASDLWAYGMVLYVCIQPLR